MLRTSSYTASKQAASTKSSSPVAFSGSFKCLLQPLHGWLTLPALIHDWLHFSHSAFGRDAFAEGVTQDSKLAAITSSCLIHACLLQLAVPLDTPEPALRRRHQSRVWNRMLHERLSIVVEDDCLLALHDLQSFQSLLIRTALFDFLIMVHDSVFVPCEELLLESLRVDHRWAEIKILGVQSALIRFISMP